MSGLLKIDCSDSRLSPNTTATFKSNPSFLMIALIASQQAKGLMPPALLMTLIFFSAISVISGRITLLTKSVAYPNFESLFRAFTIIDMVTSER